MLITDSKIVKIISLLLFAQLFTGCAEEESSADIAIIPLEKQLIAEDETWQKEIEFKLTDIELNAVNLNVISGNQTLISDNDIEIIPTEMGYQLTLTPQQNQFGYVDLIISASGDGSSANITIPFEITPVNDAPSAVNQSLFVNEDFPSNVVLQGMDVEGDVLIFEMHNQPIHGRLEGEFPELIYVPNENYFGIDSFSYTVKDDTLKSIPAVVQIQIQSVNDAPVAINKNIIVVEETPVPFVLSASDVENEELVFDITSEPHKGVLATSGPNVTYTPFDNSFGDDSFTFNVADSQGSVSSGIINLEIREQNDAPVAKSQSASTNEDTAIVITLTGADEEGDVLSYSIVNQPSKGQIVGTSPNFTYTPRDNISGVDSFTFIADDTNKQSAPAQVNITINPINDAPVAYTQALSTNENTSLNVRVVATDVENNSLMYSLVEGPKNGRLSGMLPSVSYIPNENFSGSDSFSYLASDNSINSNIADIRIIVNSVNVQPLALEQQVNVDEDAAVEITLEAQDDDGDSLIFSIVTAPTLGALGDLVDNKVAYTPDPNSTENDSFSFKVNDGQLDSEIVIVELLLTAVNDAPLAFGQSIGTEEDAPVVINLEANDIEGDALTYLIESQPEKGSLSEVNGNQITYTPNQDAVGSDSFVFKVNDGQVDSELVTVVLDITPVNDQPIAHPIAVTVTEDVTTEINLLGTDVEGGHLNFQITSSPSQGALSLLDGNSLTYTPNENATGVDHFSYRVNDGELDSDIADVNIAFNAINDLPAATAQSININEDQRKLIKLEANDADGDDLRFSIVAAPSFGQLTALDDNQLTYTPNPDSIQNDWFSFKVNDGQADSEVVTVDITVNPINDKPVVSALAVVVTEDVAKLIQLQGSDVDGDDLSFVISEQPTQGRLSVIEGNQLTYTPNENSTGSDQFSYKSNDGSLDSDVAIVNLQLISVNDLPEATAQSINIDEDQSRLIHLVGTDTDGDDLRFSIVTAPLFGQLTVLEGNQLTYTPNPDSIQNDRFSFKVNDGQADSDVVNVDITVNPVNDKPVVSALNVDVTEDVATLIQLQGNDVDGDDLSFVISEQPTQGRLSVIEGNQLTYTPNENATGSDQFLYKSNDGSLDSDVAIVNLQLISVNDLPEAIAQSISINEDQSKIINLEGFDADGDALSFSIVSQPSFGELTALEGHQLTYRPTPDSTLNDRFSFKVNDGQADSKVVHVDITVNPLNDKPVVSTLYVDVTEDVAKIIQLQGSDVDGDALSFAISEQPTQGRLSVIEGNQLTYTPSENATGNDQFLYKTNDGSLDSDSAIVNLQLIPVNDVPVATAQSISLDEDKSRLINLAGTDVDGDDLRFSIVTAPSFGQLTPLEGNQLTYTPNPDSTQNDSFSFKVNDGQADSEVANVDFIVSSVNDKPVVIAQDIDVTEDIAKLIQLQGSDVDGDDLSFVIAEQPTQGRLSVIEGNQLTYTPNQNATGSDSFSYYANDGQKNSDIAMVSIQLIAVNDLPIATPRTVVIDEDNSVFIELTGTDVDGDALNFSIVSQTEFGQLSSYHNGGVTYTPAENSTKNDEFSFLVNDGQGDSDVVAVNIIVNPVNDRPVAYTFNYIFFEDEGGSFTLRGSDIENSSLQYIVTSQPQKGELHHINGNQFTFSPNENENGNDEFTYKVNDGELDSALVTAFLTIRPVNDAPVAQELNIQVTEDTDKLIVLNGLDIDGDTLEYSILSMPRNGIVSLDQPNVAYTPAENSNDPDSFVYQVYDGKQLSTATVNISIVPVNDKPLAHNQSITIKADVEQSITLGGADIDGDALSYQIVSGPGKGLIGSVVGNKLLYKSDINASGLDQLSFKVFDGAVYSDDAIVNINIVPKVFVDSISPLSVNANGGDKVYISGRNLASVEVALNGAEILTPLVQTDTLIEVIMPEKVAGNYVLSVDDVSETIEYSQYINRNTMTLDAGHSCNSVQGGVIKCWGRNSWGQLGDGRHDTWASRPVQVLNLSGVTDMSSGDEFTCAIDSGKVVWCWGENRDGQLGDVDDVPHYSTIPLRVNTRTQALSISSSIRETCIIDVDKDVRCWGGSFPWNEKLPGTGTAVKISVGELHSCIVKEDSSVFCWGPDVDYIGDASRLSTAVDVSVGFEHGCALMADKTVWCWGRNDDDQLGTGRAISAQSIPDQVVDITNVIDLDSEYKHSCAVISDGRVYCWGDNRYGQLGNGITGGSEGRPVSVMGIDNAIQVSVGVNYSCALHDDYSMSCWGRNYHGNLGDGNFRVDSAVPVKVLH